MMKIKHLFATAILIPLTSFLLPQKTMAQEKLFTLEELNFGGNKYRTLLPENKWYAWWGDELVRIDNEQCFLVDKLTGKDIRALTDDENNERKGGAKASTIIKDHQLYVVDAQGKGHQLTTDGSREIVYGQSVHRNEFGIDKGTFWSPDGQRLAFYRMDQSMVTDYPQVDIFPREATYEPDKYPMAGMNAHVVTVGVYDINTNKTVYLKTPQASVCGDSVATSAPIYFTNIAWSPDAKTIYMFELNQSQRDGYNHLYLYSKEGKLLRQLTSGPWVVQEVLGFNAKQKSVLIAANKYHPLHRQIYSVRISNCKMTQLTTDDGVHRGELSASGTFVLDRHSSPTQPRNISLIDISSGKTVKITHLLQATDPWKDYAQPIFECGSIKAADGVTDLYYRMVKPYNFNPEKKYPTVVYVYGGPHAHNVEASWHWQSRSWETYMAQKGYIVFILDNRGSENRGRDFEQATFRQLGQIEMQDQMKGVDYLRTLPYVDMNRLGVHGWSFGGFMTISLMLNYPDVFKVGVAGGPVIDWKWYEVMYGERYMDTPQQNPEGYEKASLINKAGNLKGKLQIITGYNDNTVVPQHCLSFLDACIKAGTQPDFFAYPGEEHNMRGHASVHLHERITQYFEDYLK